jgi:hypothetical protein
MLAYLFDPDKQHGQKRAFLSMIGSPSTRRLSHLETELPCTEIRDPLRGLWRIDSSPQPTDLSQIPSIIFPNRRDLYTVGVGVDALRFLSFLFRD